MPIAIQKGKRSESGGIVNLEKLTYEIKPVVFGAVALLLALNGQSMALKVSCSIMILASFLVVYYRCRYRFQSRRRR